ncbi:hypothetical protein ASF91_19565 [Rhizobium sp. Leaf155]|nr:hypothetical protein ASF91_19565 [Rhizobium sp. Leaf155]
MNEVKTKKEQSRVWRWRRSIGQSDLPATTRQVLQALSEFMGVNGDSCFPSVDDVATKTGRDRKTVRWHLLIAENRGWLVIQSAGWTGPQHQRKSYIARWPDAVSEDADLGADAGEGAGEADPNRWGDTPPPDGADFPAYNTSPLTSPNTTPDKNASGGADAVTNKVRMRKQFLEWLVTYPGFSNFSDSEARKIWYRLTENDRRECIRLTPAFLRWSGKGKLSSPAHYLRDRAWENVPIEVAERPELIDAKSFSPLWMATRFSMLLQPPTGNVVFTAFDRNRTDKTQEEIRLEKLAVHGWPNVNDMMADMKRGRPHKCPTALCAISDAFKPVKKDGDLYAAWSRLHGRRGWPWFTFAPNYLPFPAVDLGVTNLDAAVEDAIAELETQMSKV